MNTASRYFSWKSCHFFFDHMLVIPRDICFYLTNKKTRIAVNLASYEITVLMHAHEPQLIMKFVFWAETLCTKKVCY